MKKLTCLLALLAALPAFGQHHDHAAMRQHEVAARGAAVMPFDLAATVHVFTKASDGGTQRVVARDPDDARQVALVRAHLREIAQRFGAGDFSAPERIHGAAMPGLAQLRAARPGQIGIEYRDVEGGAELVYRTADPRLADSLHQWFDAQVAEHGHDAMAGDMK